MNQRLKERYGIRKGTIVILRVHSVVDETMMRVIPTALKITPIKSIIMEMIGNNLLLTTIRRDGVTSHENEMLPLALIFLSFLLIFIVSCAHSSLQALLSTLQIYSRFFIPSHYGFIFIDNFDSIFLVNIFSSIFTIIQINNDELWESFSELLHFLKILYLLI